MGELERYPGDRTPDRTRPGLPANPDVFAVDGERISYGAGEFSQEASWNLLSQRTRDWAVGFAGEQIVDPFDRHPTFYWHCLARRDETSAPDAGPAPARYVLWVFGKAGLAVASGTTDNLDEPGGPAWRNARVELPVCGHVRSHHHTGQPPALVGAAVAPRLRSGGPNAVGHSSVTNLLPAGIGGNLGNLPVDTQRFLLAPFKDDNDPVDAADSHSYLDTQDASKLRQVLQIYLYNTHWLAYVEADRAVVRSDDSDGTALWNDSPDRRSLDQAPWQVRAWTAAISPRTRSNGTAGGQLPAMQR